MLSTEPWGLKLKLVGTKQMICSSFSALDRAVGFETYSTNSTFGSHRTFSALDRAVGFETRPSFLSLVTIAFSFSALDRAVGFETRFQRRYFPPDSRLSVLSTEPWGLKQCGAVHLAAGRALSVLSTEPWGLKHVFLDPNATMKNLSVLSTEPWGLKLVALPPSHLGNVSFSALDRAVGFETEANFFRARRSQCFQCSRPSRGV